jgi:hypothetical protein
MTYLTIGILMRIFVWGRLILSPFVKSSCSSDSVLTVSQFPHGIKYQPGDFFQFYFLSWMASR